MTEPTVTEKQEPRIAGTARRIVQLVASSCDAGGTFLYALADDGTAWQYEWPVLSGGAAWTQLAALPEKQP